MGVIMVDIDHFKKFNNTYGHIAGDLLLKELSALFQKNIRKADIVCRYGGEEFILVLPETHRETVKKRAEMLRKEVDQNLRISIENSKHASITISASAATFPHNGKTAVTLIEAADEALYQAKNSGRNRVVLAE